MRILNKGAGSYERNIKPEYLKEVQEGYFGFFKSQRELKIVVVDTSSLDFVNKPADFQQLKEVVLERKIQAWPEYAKFVIYHGIRLIILYIYQKHY